MMEIAHKLTKLVAHIKILTPSFQKHTPTGYQTGRRQGKKKSITQSNKEIHQEMIILIMIFAL